MLIVAESAYRSGVGQEHCVVVMGYEYLLAYKPFYVSDIFLLIRHSKRDRSANHAGAASATYTVNIVLGVVRKVIVYDELYSANINSPGGNVGCHQNAVFAGFKTG